MTSHFLEPYMEYAEKFTDSPKVWHYRIAICILSTIVNRKVYIRQGHRKVFPNIWMLIVAKSGWFRKSTAISIGEDVLRQVDATLIMPKEFSKEKLIEEMAERPQGIFMAYEFATFMGAISRDYNLGTQSFLTELFDCPEQYDRKLKEKTFVIRDPFINILGASTIDWLVGSIKNQDVMGGFLPRFIISSFSEKDKVLARQPIADFAVRDRLVKVLKKMAIVQGEFKFSPEAEEYYQKWFMDYVSYSEKQPNMLHPFHVRLAAYAEKMALLFCIDSGGNKIISREDVKGACTFIEAITMETAKFMDDEMSFGYFEKNQKTIEKILKAKHPNQVLHSELLRRSKLSKFDFQRVIDTLKDGNSIEAEEQDALIGNGALRKRLLYRWNVDHEIN
jgi:hypothetical protein